MIKSEFNAKIDKEKVECMCENTALEKGTKEGTDYYNSFKKRKW